MPLIIDGKEIALNANGFLENVGDWNEKVAEALAQTAGLELTDKHWDLIRCLREEFLNNNENQPNTRNLVKIMQKTWDDKNISAKTLYELFPKDPSKQGGLIAGLPESRRKGGY